jgi:hypothetical protein
MQDISTLLQAWPYNPQNYIRIIKINDEKEVLQVRKPMGIEQYELAGRPDGKQPFGKDSVLTEFEERLAHYTRTHGNTKDFSFNHEEFLLLQEEALFNYYRYLILFQIGDMERTIRDTDNNLKICELVENFSRLEEDRIQVIQYKPYILRINAVARAMTAMKQQLNTLAKEIIEDAITEIRNLPEINNMTFQFEKIRSLNYLKVTLSELDDSKTVSALDQLKLDLEDAVKIENYEKAAEIRDKIQHLTKNSD